MIHQSCDAIMASSRNSCLVKEVGVLVTHLDPLRFGLMEPIGFLLLDYNRVLVPKGLTECFMSIILMLQKDPINPVKSA